MTKVNIKASTNREDYYMPDSVEDWLDDYLGQGYLLNSISYDGRRYYAATDLQTALKAWVRNENLDQVFRTLDALRLAMRIEDIVQQAFDDDEEAN
jgi:hypothetical protein